MGFEDGVWVGWVITYKLLPQAPYLSTYGLEAEKNK